MDTILMIILIALFAIAAFSIGYVMMKQRHKKILEDPRRDHFRESRRKRHHRSQE